MMRKSLLLTFWMLVGIFFVILSEFFVPAIRESFKGSLTFLLPPIIFSLLGMMLVFLTIKGEMRKILKRFLILTGVSAAGFFLSILLHNIFYALAVVTVQISVLNYLMRILHVGFFFISIFVCPLGFLIGMIGSIILFFKNYEKE